MSKVFVSTIIGYYLGQKLPKNIRPALRGARNLEELIATITVSEMYSKLSGASDVYDAERRLRETFYEIVEEIRSVSFNEMRNAVDIILEHHAVKRTMATIGAIERGIPPEDRKFIIPVGFLTREAILSASIDELLSRLPPEYRHKEPHMLLRTHRKKALSARVPLKIKRMIEREINVKNFLLLIRAWATKEIAQDIEKIAELDPYMTHDMVRRVISARTWKDVQEELSKHPLYEYIKEINDPFEAFFYLHDKIPEIVGFAEVPVNASVERVYCGLKSLEWEVEKLVSLMNMVVI